MLEIHGWITIRESFKWDNESNNIDSIVDKIKETIENLFWDSNLLDIRYCNGIP